MANQQVRSVLDAVRAFHRRLATQYQATADRARRERLKMLLHYLARHETYVDEALSSYEQEGARAVLDAWLPPKVTQVPECSPELLDWPDDLDPDELVRRALAFDSCLLAFYRRLADQAPDDQVRALFQNLLRLEERAESTLVRDTTDFSDT